MKSSLTVYPFYNIKGRCRFIIKMASSESLGRPYQTRMLPYPTRLTVCCICSQYSIGIMRASILISNSCESKCCETLLTDGSRLSRNLSHSLRWDKTNVFYFHYICSFEKTYLAFKFISTQFLKILFIVLFGKA